ncbi:hypothetical protein EB796_004892 [Bugula neritina]|uniref:VWFA domain-containing protein n=1 Tax=Bugula neritina TaxID=10212 RepID=A0A7J7KES0_BUGNE|nr:hypothetical protein EB796_004892 [Bugula neritina]
MPEEQFEDGSIKVAMLTYSLSIDISLVFGFSWEPSGRGDVKKAIKRTEFLDDYENHGATALLWVNSIFETSNRTSSNDTNKILLYATNGQITDTDLYPTAKENSVAFVSKQLQDKGYKMFTIVPGTNVNRGIINDIASEPKEDFIIPVVNSHSLEEIASDLKSLLRHL